MAKTENKSKVVVVTGGTRGIGAEISRALMAAGYQAAATYQSNEQAAKAFKEETGALVIKSDVSDYADCEAAIKKVESKLGPVDILVNNAGITRDGVLHKMDPENWHAVIGANLNSCFNMCRLVVGGMRDRKYGRIVNISSINAQKGQFGQTNYSAAKAGMIGFTKALALENAGRGVTVNAICPGYIETDMTAAIPHEVLENIIKQIPVGRMGHPDEIAALVAFLVSDKAGFITGATISANGGQFMG
jgi:acetoacetyl-CoA reductase